LVLSEILLECTEIAVISTLTYVVSCKPTLFFGERERERERWRKCVLKEHQICVSLCVCVIANKRACSQSTGTRRNKVCETETCRYYHHRAPPLLVWEPRSYSKSSGINFTNSFAQSSDKLATSCLAQSVSSKKLCPTCTVNTTRS